MSDWGNLLKRLILSISLAVLFASTANAADITIGWNYNKAPYEGLVGFRLYQGTSPDGINTLVEDIPKADVSVFLETPTLLNETFDEDPGDKYPLTNGAWVWVEETKNMKIESENFMVVFELPAGDTNAISFWFWPHEALGDQAQLYNYNKDEALAAYYELRFGSNSGVRYSNFRKVYDQQYGGVHPNGAFPLPRYPQCASSPCKGFRIDVAWYPGFYTASVFNQDTEKTVTVQGDDLKALNINKLEIISKQQTFWLDDIRIGGFLELRKRVSLPPLAQGESRYLAMSAYNDTKESEKSIAVELLGDAPVNPTIPSNVRLK